MESLALKYRPRTFDDLIGQRVVQVVLRQMVHRNDVHPALLFAGCRGSGKTTSLRLLAAALNCDNPPGPCGGCPSCKDVFNGTSLDLIEIDAASHGLVDDIRSLRQHLMCSTAGRWRVVGLDEAHSVSAAGFNALLKILEEPPPGTVFVLLTTDPGRIPDTVADRCMRFTFGRIAPADIVSRLAQICASEHLDAEPALLRLLADRADGGMRNAIVALDQYTRVGIGTVAQFQALTGETDPGPTIVAALLAGNPAATYAAVNEALTRTADPHTVVNALTGVFRDICILRAGGEPAAYGPSLLVRQQFAAAVHPGTAFAAMKILWDLKTKIRAGEDPRSILDLAIAMLHEVFAPSTAATGPAPPSPERKLTLADMAALAPTGGQRR